MQVEPRAPAHSQGFSKGFASAALGTTPVKRSCQAAGALPVLGEPLVESPDVQQRDFLPRQLCSQHSISAHAAPSALVQEQHIHSWGTAASTARTD